MPRAGSHYNLGTSRGPDKIGSRAGPGPRAVSCTWLVYALQEKVFMDRVRHCHGECGTVDMHIEVGYGRYTQHATWSHPSLFG